MKKRAVIGMVLLGALAPAQAAESVLAPAGGAAAGPQAGGAAAGPQVGGAAAGPQAGAAGDPADVGGGAAAPQRRALEATPPPSERTARPAAAEWDAAEQVSLARAARGGACKARRQREWLRIDCSVPSVVAVRSLGTGAGGESVSAGEHQTEEDGSFPSSVSVTFPVRIGDRRVIEILSFEEGYRFQAGLSTSVVISEQWLEGDAGPLVSAL
ncbi:hypothetical protein [Sorangium sp. So ce1000]|uniref:hypothetical protein n=1 Tax=Sorangium sp. So ce1000 TaxID=3133325 RepID=UPI003F5D6A63